MSKDDAIRLAVRSLKAGEKGVKPDEIEIAVIDASNYTKYHAESGAKFLKKYW